MERAAWERSRRALLSGFICLNLATVLWMNCPSELEARINRTLDSLRGGRLLRLLSGADQRYGHAVGLDNRWTMFGHKSRFNWWYFIKGQYRNGDAIVLPIEGQVSRTFWQHNLFDFKEAKFQLNIYQSKPARQAYAHY